MRNTGLEETQAGIKIAGHRIGLTYEAEAENISTEEIITEILNNVIVP